MGTISITEVKFQERIYPRGKPSTQTIEDYADALLAGETMPPIILERETNRLLDGYHRWKAHERLAANPQLFTNGKRAEDFATIEVEFHDIPEGIPAKLYAAKLSARHGLRLKASEVEALARELCTADPDLDVKVIAEYVGRSQRSVYDYVRDIKARKEEQERAVLMRLDRLGWTQQEMGDVLGVTQQGAAKLLQQIAELQIVVKSTLTSGIPHSEVAERFNLPLQLIWAIDLDGRDDAERMKRLNINVQPYDVWNFAKSGDLFGAQHPGRIPGELIAHVLYFYTNQGDVVIDPMVGGGTTLDTCLVMGRKCYGFDIDQRHGRKDVITHNIAVDGWHPRTKKADLIFWDPPYFDKMDSSTIGEDGYIEGSISKLDRDAYLDFFSQRLHEAASIVKRGCKLAFLMSDWDDNTGERDGIFLWDYADLIRAAGWKLVRHIQTPLSTQQVHPDIVNKFRASRRLARLERYLLIAEAK